MKQRVSVRGIIIHDDALLCVRLKPYNPKGTFGSTFWCVPGGGLDEGESLVDGIERELIEETGIQPVVGNLLFIQQFSLSGIEQLEFFFHITNSKAYLKIDLTKTTHGQKEIAEIAFIDPTKFPVLPEFLKTESLSNITSQTPTKIFNYL